MNDRINKWQRFLDSLATRGGAILILFCMAMVGIVVVFWALKYQDSEKVWAFATGYAMGWTSALSLALKASDTVPSGKDEGAAPSAPQKS